MQPSELTVALLWDCLCDTIRTLFLCVAENGECGAGSGSELRTGGAAVARNSCTETCLELRYDSDLGAGRTLHVHPC